MKTKQMLNLTVLLFGVFLGQQAHAFYNPSIGCWLNRDPASEGAGRNLHGFVDNAPVQNFDFIRLVGMGNVRFRERNCNKCVDSDQRDGTSKTVHLVAAARGVVYSGGTTRVEQITQ
jgi:hypothetical protein